MNNLFNSFDTYFKRDAPPPTKKKINTFNKLTNMSSYSIIPDNNNNNNNNDDNDNDNDLNIFYETLYDFSINKINVQDCLAKSFNKTSHNCFKDTSVELTQDNNITYFDLNSAKHIVIKASDT